MSWDQVEFKTSDMSVEARQMRQKRVMKRNPAEIDSNMKI